jgi:hypothetical protein
MKYLFTLLLMSLMIISCNDKSELPIPTSHESTIAARNADQCAYKTAQVQQDMTNGTTEQWLVFYYDTTGALIQHPLIDNVNGTVYEYTYITDSTGHVNEYNIVDDSLVLFNYGTYTIIECGETILPNTLIFNEETRVEIDKSNPVKFETYIEAPLGPNGSIIPIIGKGTPY